MPTSYLLHDAPTTATDPLRDSSVLITGCNTGIGLELARHVLALGAGLHFTCRSSEKVAATAALLSQEYPQAQIHGHLLDLSRQASVDALVAELASGKTEIDTVILNAGVHIPFARRLTPDGLEVHRQVNFLSPARLFLRLSHAQFSVRRVLYVSSNAHQRGHLPALFPLSFWARYARSKLLATTFFKAARPLFPEIRISVMSPGNVHTDVHRYKPSWIRWSRGFIPGAQDPKDAAEDLIEATFFGEEWEEYRNRGSKGRASLRCDDPSLKMRVWQEVVAALRAPVLEVGPTHVMENHAGTLSNLAPAVRVPESEAEAAAVVRRARVAGRTVRAVGARHSYNDCFYSESELVSLEALDDIGPIDGENATITVGAGVKVQALCDHLDENGYALRWAGNSGQQTLVGAAITGTHGYCREGGLLAELIVGARVVTGLGEIRSVTDEEELRAVRVSLGTLGFVTSVTLSLVPSGSPVRYALETLDESDFLSKLPSLAKDNEYFRFFPNRYHPDRFSVLTINESTEIPSEEELERVRFIDKTSAPRIAVAGLRALMRSRSMHSVLRRLPAPRLCMSFTAPFSTLLFVNAGVVNRWYRLSGLAYQAWNDDRTRNMELAIRPRDFGSFLRIFRKATVEARLQIGDFSAYFTGRYVGRSDRTLLGPNHGYDVIFVDVHVRKNPTAQDFLRTLEARLQREMAVRPHWGKEFSMTRAELEGSYPRQSWEAFARMKDRFDPDNVFTNAYTKRVFGW